MKIEKRTKIVNDILVWMGKMAWIDLGVIAQSQQSVVKIEEDKRTLLAGLVLDWTKQRRFHAVKTRKDENSTPINKGKSFRVQAQLPTGMIAYEFPLEYWDEFHIKEVHTAMACDANDILDNSSNKLKKWSDSIYDSKFRLWSAEREFEMLEQRKK